MTPPTTLESTAQDLLAVGKGLLAADESFPTIEKRFKALNIFSNEDNRRAYREMLFTTPQLKEFVSGVILFDETIHQTINGGMVPEALDRQGIIMGIKVDQGTASLPGFAKEKLTKGLDSLRERLATYRELGARFTKWRAVIAIGDATPTKTCIAANAHALALFAALSQEAGLVPIVEPEVLMDGNHTIERCAEVTELTLKTVFAELFNHRVALEGMLLKSGMVLSGKDCPTHADTATVAQATIRCFRHVVPAAVPGIVFLSGGQGDIEATERLNAICQVGGGPWKISFSYGRALQDAALKTWQGNPANVQAAQKALLHRAHCNSLAVRGIYSAQAENLGA